MIQKTSNERFRQILNASFIFYKVREHQILEMEQYKNVTGANVSFLRRLECYIYKTIGWKCPPGHVEIIFEKPSNQFFLLKARIKFSKFSDLFKKMAKNIPLTTVLRIHVFVKNCTYWAKSGSPQFPRTLEYLCFSWSFQQFHFWAISDPPSTKNLLFLKRLRLFSVMLLSWESWLSVNGKMQIIWLCLKTIFLQSYKEDFLLETTCPQLPVPVYTRFVEKINTIWSLHWIPDSLKLQNMMVLVDMNV